MEGGSVVRVDPILDLCWDCGPSHQGEDAWSLEATRMTIATRIDLDVSFTRKEEAKALGARWDANQRTWYAPAGTDLRRLRPALAAEGVRSRPGVAAPVPRGGRRGREGHLALGVAQPGEGHH